MCIEHIIDNFDMHKLMHSLTGSNTERKDAGYYRFEMDYAREVFKDFVFTFTCFCFPAEMHNIMDGQDYQINPKVSNHFQESLWRLRFIGFLKQGEYSMNGSPAATDIPKVFEYISRGMLLELKKN